MKKSSSCFTFVPGSKVQFLWSLRRKKPPRLKPLVIFLSFKSFWRSFLRFPGNWAQLQRIITHLAVTGAAQVLGFACSIRFFPVARASSSWIQPFASRVKAHQRQPSLQSWMYENQHLTICKQCHAQVFQLKIPKALCRAQWRLSRNLVTNRMAFFMAIPLQSWN